jgi:DNA-binding Lrp family transcriptional regulator
MRNIEWKVLSQLMKNARISDRELAKKIGSSQPTVTRTRRKLEKQGYIREYAMIPDFPKIGYKILALTFALSQALNKEEAERARKLLAESVKNRQFEFIMLERGLGLGFDAVIISLHKDYSSYVDVLKWLRGFDFVDVTKIDSFLVDLADEVHYRPLTFSTLAEHLSLQAEKSSKP